jgi:hypothetical protein
MEYCSIIAQTPTATWNEDSFWLLVNKSKHQDSQFILVNSNVENIHVSSPLVM